MLSGTVCIYCPGIQYTCAVFACYPAILHSVQVHSLYLLSYYPVQSVFTILLSCAVCGCYPAILSCTLSVQLSACYLVQSVLAILLSYTALCLLSCAVSLVILLSCVQLSAYYLVQSLLLSYYPVYSSLLPILCSLRLLSCYPVQLSACYPV